jgi:hypothetical protein
MFRRVLLCLLLAATVAGSSPGLGLAQSSSPRADRQTTFTVDGSGTYLSMAGPALTGAFDRAMQELDGFPEQTTPDAVKSSTFRRRLLELRVMMDLEAYAYDPILLHTFRKAVDDAYEQVGDFQDVSVIQQILGAPVRDDVVNQRLIKMNVVLASLRTNTVRSAMRNFLASPSSSLQTLSPGDTPRLWTLAGITPNEQLDGAGNASLLASAVFSHLQGGDIFVSDIFDKTQEAQFHATRKDVRSTLLIVLAFQPSRDATRGTSEPLWSLVSQYGDTNDAVVAWRTAQNYGGPVDTGANAVRSEFTMAQGQQQAVLDAKSFGAMIGALNNVQNSHRR